ncbi:hypothetical protein JW859_12335 [bacterium]|nr:hypothetical protein [bacterium]
MDSRVKQQLAWLERRSRFLTGAVLAIMVLAATYGLLLYEGQLSRPGLHFYPWLAAILFYIAGDLLAYVWFKVVAIRVQVMHEDLLNQQRLMLEEQGLVEETPSSDVDTVEPEQGS